MVSTFPRQKTNKLKLTKQCGRQANKRKTWSFEMFLLLRGQLHWVCQKRKFKALFYGKNHRNSFFLFQYIFRCYRDRKPKKPFGPMDIHSITWHDMTWYDMTWQDMTWHRDSIRLDNTELNLTLCNELHEKSAKGIFISIQCVASTTFWDYN